MIPIADELQLGLQVVPDFTGFEEALAKKANTVRKRTHLPVKIQPSLFGVQAEINKAAKTYRSKLHLDVALKPIQGDTQTQINKLSKKANFELPVALTVDLTTIEQQKANIQKAIETHLGTIGVQAEAVLTGEDKLKKDAEEVSKKSSQKVAFEATWGKKIDWTDPRYPGTDAPIARLDARTANPDNQKFYTRQIKALDDLQHNSSTSNLSDEMKQEISQQANAFYGELEDLRASTNVILDSTQAGIERRIKDLRKSLATYKAQATRLENSKSPDAVKEYKSNAADKQSLWRRLATATNDGDATQILDKIGTLTERNATLQEKYSDAIKETKFSETFIKQLEGMSTSAQKRAGTQMDAAAKLGLDNDAVAKARAALAALKSAANSTFENDEQVTAYVQKVRELNAATEAVEQNVKALQQQAAQQILTSNVSKAKDEFTALSTKWSEFMRDDVLRNKYNDLLGKFDVVQTEQQFKSLQAEVRAFKAEVTAAGKNTQTFSAKIQHALGKYAQYLSVSTVIMSAVSVVNRMIKTTMELDEKITDLQIASGKARDEVKEMVREYADMGRELGATAVDVATAADTFLRQGQSTANTNDLIRDSMMLSKLGQIDAAEASKALTSAMKGYKVEAQDVTSIVDKLTAVDMEAAASAGGIAKAMAETATSADLAGISMDRLIGYLTTVIEVTQAGDEEIGNAFKSLIARMGAIKSGELVDPETSESLSDVETTLTSVGIKLRDSGDQFRDFGVILDEVAGNWSSYSNVQQRAIAAAFTGTRQQEKFYLNRTFAQQCA